MAERGAGRPPPFAPRPQAVAALLPPREGSAAGGPSPVLLPRGLARGSEGSRRLPRGASPCQVAPFVTEGPWRCSGERRRAPKTPPTCRSRRLRCAVLPGRPWQRPRLGSPAAFPPFPQKPAGFNTPEPLPGAAEPTPGATASRKQKARFRFN